MSEYQMSEIPKENEIIAQIGMLRPIFLEGYRRSKAHWMFPHAQLILTPNEYARLGQPVMENDAPPGSYYSYELSPDNRELTVPYRMSELLQIYMPLEVPPDDRRRVSFPEAYDYWIGSTTADDEVINAYATRNANDDIAAIQAAFQPVFDECDVDSLRGLLFWLNKVSRGFTELLRPRPIREFEEIKELFQDWTGSDADYCFNRFGRRVEPAARKHREMIAELVRSASEEGKAQCIVLIELFNTVVAMHERIREFIHGGTTYVEDALRRYIGSIIVNRVPFLDDLLDTVDFIVEIASEGEQQGFISGIVRRIREWVPPAAVNVPTVEVCNEVRDLLIEAGQTQRDRLYGLRNSFGSELAWTEGLYTVEEDCVLIPGYPE